MNFSCMSLCHDDGVGKDQAKYGWIQKIWNILSTYEQHIETLAFSVFGSSGFDGNGKMLLR
jgi:hypothetical protein